MDTKITLVLISLLVIFSLGCSATDAPYCGDGNCERDKGECEVSCPEDCETTGGDTTTGDGTTTGGETTGTECGDGVCEGDECEVSCPEDCVTTGDGTTTGDDTTSLDAILEVPDSFKSTNIQCQVGEHDPSWSPPEIYYMTDFMYNDGDLSILDDPSTDPDFSMTVQPCGLHIFPISPLGASMMEYLNPGMFTMEGNFVYGVNDSGVTVAADNRANTTTDGTIIYHGRNTTIVVQRDGDSLGNTSCGPASGTAIINQINDTLGGTLVHPGNDSVIDVLRRKMGTTSNGTKLFDIIVGLREFLAQAGQAGNYVIKVFGNYTFANGTAWNGGYIRNDTQVNWTSMPTVTWVKYFMEFYMDSEHVILSLKRTSDGQGHAVAADNVRMTATKNYISFMDPWDGDIKEHEVDENSCMNLWNQEWCINHMISISPVE